ncbi:uncharacterized protein LOC134269818 [Saccostrea cucullata]|uniref:uncharacterized protein LOC134269818 n=1 Tax=Saccostrea cuccullata TaxID=36930 RepID=UPI002ED2B037
MVELVEAKKELILKIEIENENLQNLKSIYQRNRSYLKSRLMSLPKYYEKQREDIHKTRARSFLKWKEEIDYIALQLQRQLHDMESEDIIGLKKQEEFFKEKLADIDILLKENKDLKVSNKIDKLVGFKPTSENFTNLPALQEYSRPKFHEKTFEDFKMKDYFGEISGRRLLEYPAYRVQNVEEVKINKKILLKHPSVLYKTNLKSMSIEGGFESLNSIVHFTYNRIWVGERTCLVLVDFNGVLIDRVDTASFGNCLALSSKGYLLFNNTKENTIDEILCDRSFSTIISAGAWVPQGFACTSAGELFVCLYKKDDSKVAKYTETGELISEYQYDKENRLLFTAPDCIAVNVNNDICTTDLGISAVVIIKSCGELRFTYDGKSLSKLKREFLPTSIATDRYGHILIADSNNSYIHVISSEGEFLQLMSLKNSIECPFSVCVADEKFLVIGEKRSGIMYVTKYLKKHL